METMPKQLNLHKTKYVLILPMRNGNGVPSGCAWLYVIVLILPMRNGNIDQMRKYEIVDISGSYPTYEEWKQSTDGRKHLIIPPVLILPMRNGNPAATAITYLVKLFLSYLWGMETFLTISFAIISLLSVLILPMRNGNFLNYYTYSYLL